MDRSATLRRARCVLATSLALLGWAHRPAGAQRPTAAEAALTLGIARLPDALQTSCGGPENYVAADARGGVWWSAVGVQARVTAEAEVGNELCPMVPRIQGDGIHTERLYAKHAPGMLAGDLRLILTPPAAALLRFGLGGGWSGSHAVPYLIASLGLRTGRCVGAVLDLERTWFRVPWERVTAEWQGGVPVREIQRETGRHWPGGWAVRAGARLRL